MYEKEKLIKEQRLAEAVRDNLVGMEGKFGIILKAFGRKIISNETSNYDSTALEDFYAIPEDGLPTIDLEEFMVYEHGISFNGLSRGYHLEISYYHNKEMDYDNGGVSELCVTYKGEVVYKELGGDLVTYVPQKEWNDIIDKLYKAAKEKHQKDKTDIIENLKNEHKREKLSFLSELRKRWGI